MISLLTSIIQSFFSLGKVVILSKFIGILKTKAKNNKTKCIILGNGPSLTNSIEKYKSTFHNYDLICVNNFAISDLYKELRPKFYIINANIMFFNEPKISPKYIKMRNEFFENISNNTSWELQLMVPFIAKKSKYFKSFLKQNPTITPLYFNSTPIDGLPRLNHFLFNLGLGSPRPHNVLIPAIINSIYLGYQDIYIVGADHSWLPEISVNDENIALVNQKHFYDENESKPDKMEDFVFRPRRLHEIIHKFYLSFKGYWEIKGYATSKKVNIFNASEYSMIDAFDRKKIS